MNQLVSESLGNIIRQTAREESHRLKYIPTDEQIEELVELAHNDRKVGQLEDHIYEWRKKHNL